MEIIQSQLPPSLSEATTLEGVVYLLADKINDEQSLYNNGKPDSERKEVIVLTQDDSLDEPYRTIQLKEIEFNILKGQLRAIDPFKGEIPYTGNESGFPWNLDNSSLVEALAQLLILIYRLEKQTTYNPDNEEPMSLTWTANNNINEPMLTVEASLSLILSKEVDGEFIKYKAKPYLVGSMDFSIFKG